jgi:hypothetical protein
MEIPHYPPLRWKIRYTINITKTMNYCCGAIELLLKKQHFFLIYGLHIPEK